jgi:hypothetical protein
MRTNDFFIEMANQYISLIDEVASNLIPSMYYSYSNTVRVYINQQRHITDIKLKTEQLLLEFGSEQGKVFYNYLREYKTAYYTTPEEKVKDELNIYKHVLSLLISHIKTFKISDVQLIS